METNELVIIGLIALAITSGFLGVYIGHRRAVKESKRRWRRWADLKKQYKGRP